MNPVQQIFIERLRRLAETVINLVKEMRLTRQQYQQAYVNAIALKQGYLPLRVLHIPPCNFARTLPKRGDVWRCRCIELTYKINELYSNTIMNFPYHEELLTSYNWWIPLIPNVVRGTPLYLLDDIGQYNCI